MERSWNKSYRKFGTNINAIAIEPIGCSLTGSLSVQGIINVDPLFCGSAGPSATATINLISSTPSVTITVPQGYTGSRACDTNPITFNALLDPSLSCVSNYSWIYPAGWTFVSQSGNSITLRPSGNLSDAGTVKGNVNFTCGTTVSGVANIQFIAPVVIGNSLLCSIENYTIQNAASNPTVSWSTNNANVTINSSGMATRLNNYNGAASILANVCGTAATPKSIYVGLPAADNTTLLWLGTRGVNPVSTTPGGTYYFRGDQVAGASTYTWLLPSGFTTLNNSSTTTYTPNIYLTTSYTAGRYTLYCQANNACGSMFTASLTINNGSTGGGGCTKCPPPPQLLKTANELTNLTVSNPVIFPNPTNDDFTVSLFTEKGNPIEGTIDSLVQLTLYNNLQQIIHQSTTNKSLFNISTEGMPTGTYYFTIEYKGEVTSKRLLIVK